MAGQDPKWQKDASDQNFDYMFKLLIIGNSSVGKTSFLFRYADDSFTSAFVSTVGIDFKVKTVFRNDKRVKLQIWVSVTQKTLHLSVSLSLLPHLAFQSTLFTSLTPAATHQRRSLCLRRRIEGACKLSSFRFELASFLCRSNIARA